MADRATPSEITMSWRGLCRLKPFDDGPEDERAPESYRSSVLMTVLSGASSLTAIGAVLGAATGLSAALELLGVALGLSAITAGLEWHAGLRARALNQLFVIVLVVAAASVLGLTAPRD